MSLAPINQEPEAEPEAELIGHLRNGIAHGNKFSMRGDVIDPKTGCLRLPAHNQRYAKVLSMRGYAVDTHLNGSNVLFDYGGPAAILDILTVLGWHLTRTACGFLGFLASLTVAFLSNSTNVGSRHATDQEALAHECGINRTYLSAIERAERNISIDNIERISRGLRVEPFRLLQDT